MKKIIFTLIVIVAFAQITIAQCETHFYLNIAQSVFNHQIKPSDFPNGRLFLTIDTVDASNPNVKSECIDYYKPADLIKKFYKVFNHIKIEGSFYNYYEFINFSVFPSPLHQSFLINTVNNTFMIDIWNNKDDVLKIDGLTIVKLDSKRSRTPY